MLQSVAPHQWQMLSAAVKVPDQAVSRAKTKESPLCKPNPYLCLIKKTVPGSVMIHCNSCPGSPSQSMSITPHLQHLEQLIKMSERNNVSIDMQNSTNVGRLVLFGPWIANRLLANTKTAPERLLHYTFLFQKFISYSHWCSKSGPKKPPLRWKVKNNNISIMRTLNLANIETALDVNSR